MNIMDNVYDVFGDIVGTISAIDPLAKTVTIAVKTGKKAGQLDLFTQYIVSEENLILKGNGWVALDSSVPIGDEEHVSALDVQVGGDHYKDCAIQPVQYITENGLGFLEGCVVKRVTRHNKPTGKGRQDIEKAIHELQLLMELTYGDTE